MLAIEHRKGIEHDELKNSEFVVEIGITRDPDEE